MTKAGDMFSAIRENFPDAELIERRSCAGPCMTCLREATRGLSYKSNPICARCAPYAGAGEMMLNFSDTEVEAIDAGGAAAGEYLDTIGKTDLAELSPDQWQEFLGKFLDGYSTFMQEEAKRYPPF